ncbi:MAG TPA: gliding motility-associated C-terminal domain-containing protein [Bacteroidia bacterium]|nr:gliding motility-associated C-terminal domain-containing protein [Bacteroidia bacterium]
MKRFTIIFISFFFCIINGSAQSWNWGRENTEPPHGAGSPQGNHCVATDPLGNAYIIGQSFDTLAFGTDTVLSSSGIGSYLVKYDINGKVKWARGANGIPSPNFQPMGVSADAASNVYVTGCFNNMAIFGKDTLFNPNNWSLMYLVKYDSNGNVLWAKESSISDSCEGFDVASDLSGNAYVTGIFTKTVAFGTDTLESTGGGIVQVFIVKYAPNGNVIWATKSSGRPGPYGPTSNSIALDHSGNAYITGFLSDTLKFGANTLYLSHGFSNSFIAKFDKNGNALWARQSVNNTNFSWATGISVGVDALSNAYITGNFEKSVTFGADTITNYIQQGVFFSRYDSSGNLRWVKQGNPLSVNPLLHGFSIACDTLPSGGGFLVLNMSGNLPIVLKFGVDTFSLSTSSYSATILFQFDSSGNVLCGSVTSQGGDGSNDGVAADHSGKHIYISGNLYWEDATIFGNDTLKAHSPYQNAFVAQWNRCCVMPIHVSPIDTAICEGDSVTLNASGASDFYWLPHRGLNTTSDSTVITNTTISTVYEVAGKSPGCIGFATVTVNVDPNPNITISPPNDSVCKGQSTTLNASGALTYIWSPSSGLSCTTCSVPNASPDSTVTYSLVGIDVNGCKDSSKITVFVKPPPVAVITALPSDSICIGDTVHLIGSGGTSYLWSNASTSSSISVTPSSTILYTVVVTGNGCSKDTSISIIVDSVPLVVITSPQKICPGKTITLLAAGGGKYLWSTGATTDSISVSPTSTTTYSVIVSKACKATSSTVVTVENPVVYACCDTTISSGNSVNLNAGGSDIIHYQWTPSTGINCDTCPDVIVSPTVTTTYTVVGTDSLGCETERILVVNVEMTCGGLTVPNVFTPDNAGPNGVNSIFYIKTENISSWSITIYDRWGKEIFKSGNPLSYWDGATEGGSKAPDGVYYYIISATCQNNTYKKDGFVQLIR